MLFSTPMFSIIGLSHISYNRPEAPAHIMKRIHQLFCLMAFVLLYAHQSQAQHKATLDSLAALLPLKPDTSNTEDFYQVAHLHYQLGGSVDTLEYFAHLIADVGDQFDHNASRMRAYYLKGQIAYKKQKIGEAKISFDKANEYLDTTQITTWNSKIPNAIGVIYLTLEENETALKYLQEAQRAAEVLKADQLLGPTYTNIAILLGNLSEFDRAFTYFHKSIQASRRIGNKYGELGTMYSMVAAFLNVNELDSAQIYTTTYLKESEELKWKLGIIRGNRQLAEIYMRKKLYERSVQFTDTVFLKADTPDRDFHFLAAYRVKAMSLAELGRTAEAEVAIDSAFQVLKRIPRLIYHANTYENLAEVYSALGQYDKAYDYQQKSSILRDSLYGEEQRNKISVMQNMYEMEKTQRQLAELNQRTERQAFQIRQRNLLLFGLALISSLVLLSLYLFTQQRILKVQEKVAKIEYRLFRLQMNPHFLFNTLSAIQSFLFDAKNTKKAISYLAKFSQLMRQVLEYSRENQISLEDEIKTLENYLSLQQLRYDNAFDYEIEVDPSINPWEVQIPPILAQPFVENAIEHGKVHLAENGKIWVRFRKSKNHLHLIVEDNGIGREKAQQSASMKTHKSLASEITRDRLDILSDLNRQEVDFKIIDLPEKGTKVVFELPIVETI